MKKQISKSVLLLVLIFSTCGINAQNSVHFTKSTPEAEGISSEAILSFIDSVEKKIDVMHSFMIIRHGHLVSQGWWFPYNAETPHVMHSLSKSFTSTAIGIAIDEGLLSLNDQVISFFPVETPPDPDYNLKAMRIRDLLTMNTGHIKEPRVQKGEDDWVKIFLHAKVELKPGTHFKYNSMATYMLSAIIQRVTGEKLVDFLEPRLFEPLGIEKPEWDTCPRGINTGGWGLHIRTEDIAKLGQLYLQKGIWNGKQILSEKWVEMATSKQVSNGSNPDNDWEQGYGFQFWRCRHNCYRGDGAMGQFCIVMPNQDAVIAITSGTSNMPGILNLVWEILLPAMKDQPLAPNPTKLGELKHKTANLKLKPVVGQKDSPISKKISGHIFKISTNKEGVKSISFNTSVKEPYINIVMEDGSENFRIGSNEYLKGKMQNHLPFTNHMPKSIAASGAWINPDKYQVRIYLYETPARITYTFYFQDDRLIWDTKLENALFGPRQQEQFTGKISM